MAGVGGRKLGSGRCRACMHPDEYTPYGVFGEAESKGALQTGARRATFGRSATAARRQVLAVTCAAALRAVGVVAADDGSTEPTLADAFLLLARLAAGMATVTVAARAADGATAVSSPTPFRPWSPCVHT